LELGLPNRRELAETMYQFVGYIFPFDPSVLMNQAEMKMKLVTVQSRWLLVHRRNIDR